MKAGITLETNQGGYVSLLPAPENEKRVTILGWDMYRDDTGRDVAGPTIRMRLDPEAAAALAKAILAQCLQEVL